MPLLWVHYDSQQWTVVPIDRYPLGLTADRLCPVVQGNHDSPAVLLPKIDDEICQWALIVRPGEEEIVHVNGDRVMLGIRALRDRDAIQIGGGERIYFTTESAPMVSSYPEGKAPVPCARCGTLIKPGDLSVKCPQCRAWFHQSEDFPCWLYADACVCGHRTQMNEENCWRPDEP